MALLATLIIGCKDEQKETKAIEQKHIKEAKAHDHNHHWAGTYEGVLPCADCPGIKTVITLKDDHTYTLVREYLESDGTTDNETGKFRFDEASSIVSLELKASVAKYKLMDTGLIALDSEGKEVTGKLADNYKLTKK